MVVFFLSTVFGYFYQFVFGFSLKYLFAVFNLSMCCFLNFNTARKSSKDADTKNKNIKMSQVQR